MRRETVAVATRPISYLIAEPSTPAPRQRPPQTVVFLHAFPLQAAMWESSLRAVPEGWRAVAPDLRGFGQSALPGAADPSMADFAGDVIDLLDHLKVKDAAVVGCSMGGYVLFEMLRSAPRYISAVGLVSTRPGADSDDGRRNREKMIDQVDREGVAAIAAQMTPKLLGATTARERPDLVGRVRQLCEANTREGINAAIRAMMTRGDSTPLLAQIDVPALVVAGVEDGIVPPAEAERMHRAIAGSQHASVPSAGHLPNLEQPALFDTLLSQFLQTL